MFGAALNIKVIHLTLCKRYPRTPESLACEFYFPGQFGKKFRSTWIRRDLFLNWTFDLNPNQGMTQLQRYWSNQMYREFQNCNANAQVQVQIFLSNLEIKLKNTSSNIRHSRCGGYKYRTWLRNNVLISKELIQWISQYQGSKKFKQLCSARGLKICHRIPCARIRMYRPSVSRFKSFALKNFETCAC